jgi:4-hydroxymandelate synthase
MAVRDIGYVELYTNDKRSAADYFVSSLGFTLVAESADGDSDSVLLRQGAVQLLVTAGPATRAFLDAHGDGVADIAFTCDDVSATCAAAVAAGAEIVGSLAGSPVLSGFGGTCHTLLPSAAAAGQLPAGHAWRVQSAEPAPAGLAGQGGRILLLDHIAICIEAGALEYSADRYQEAFGLARYSSEYVEFGDQAMDSIVVRSPSGGTTFTLVEPDPAKSAGQLDAFLERNGGQGVQHLAFLVDDILPAVSEFRCRGVEFLRTPESYYEKLAERLAGMTAEIAGLRAAQVLADRDEWGYLLQLFTRSPYERNTLFYELIQRRGARGFGSANIRALYEAVERDRLAAE